jgi:hypothetical protein
MGSERRRDKRRDADRVLREVVDILRILERISQGEEIDFSETYTDLVGMKDKLGRREEDHKLGEALCTALESLARNLGALLEKERQLRKVRIIKLSGRKGASLDIQSSLIGWEEDRPKIGKHYRVFKEDGGVFRSALVTKVAHDHFQTQNSLYQIEVLQETA